jgi:folylpolyglutamate synthase/dihydropteroate synthase
VVVGVPNALVSAMRNAKEDDLIFVGGSIFVVAEVLKISLE